jgi:nucleotide-binding universal stress UspA family protein
MIQFKNILCPVDFFPASERALEYAIALARNYNAKLHILHVVAPVLPTSYEFSVNTAELVETFKQTAEKRVSEIAGGARDQGIETETTVHVGDIDVEIAGAIDSSNADIVVMGTHGRRGFERWFLGSVTERILRHSPKPVLVLSETDRPIAVPPDVKSVLVTTDFSEGTEAAVGLGVALAEEAPARLTMLHVVEQPPEYQGSVEGVAKILEEHLDTMIPESVRQWCTVQSEVRIGTPYQRILAMAHEENVDLIVMNIHGKGVFERAVLGSTAERVLRGAECPVLAVPAAKR